MDTQKIGEGIYQIICDKGEEALVAFGMLPMWVMELCEKQLRQKVIEEAAKQAGCTVMEMALLVDEKLITATVNPIMREVGIAIYGAASRAGKMVV